MTETLLETELMPLVMVLAQALMPLEKALNLLVVSLEMVLKKVLM